MEAKENSAEVLVETRRRYYMDDSDFYWMVGVFGAWDEVAAARQAELPAMREAYEHAELDLNVEAFNYFIDSLKQEEPLDPYEYTLLLEACSSDLAAVMQADSGLLRPQRGREQIEAELRGFEEDYLRLYVDPDDPNQQKLADMRQILRTTCLLRSVMKPFVKALTGFNGREEIEPYINGLCDILFSQLGSEVMSPEVQQTVRLFWKYDIAGKLLWENGYNQQEHQTMKAECPPEFAGDIDDLVLVSYLCSGGAHTKHRWYTNRGRQHPAVLPIDDEIQPQTGDPGTLNRFFGRSYPGGPLKLDVGIRQRVVEYLQCTPRVGELLEYYVQYAEADGVWSATLKITEPGVYMSSIREAINEQAIASGLPINALVKQNKETGEVKSVSLVRDPSGSRGTPEAQQYEAVVSNLGARSEWQHNPDHDLGNQGDVYACIGIIPGYDHNRQPSYLAISHVMSELKKQEPDITCDIKYRQLYAVWTNDGKLIGPNEEPVLVVTATYQDSVDIEDVKTLLSKAAAMLGQARYYGAQKEHAARGLAALTFAQGS